MIDLPQAALPADTQLHPPAAIVVLAGPQQRSLTQRILVSCEVSAVRPEWIEITCAD